MKSFWNLEKKQAVFLLAKTVWKFIKLFFHATNSQKMDIPSVQMKVEL